MKFTDNFDKLECSKCGGKIKVAYGYDGGLLCEKCWDEELARLELLREEE
jgi:recombinational DNA repair protein (RecF pathway)